MEGFSKRGPLGTLGSRDTHVVQGDSGGVSLEGDIRMTIFENS